VYNCTYTLLSFPKDITQLIDADTKQSNKKYEKAVTNAENAVGKEDARQKEAKLEKQNENLDAGKRRAEKTITKKHKKRMEKWAKRKESHSAHGHDLQEGNAHEQNIQDPMRAPENDLKVKLKSFKENKASGALETTSKKSVGANGKNSVSNREKMKQTNLSLQKKLERVFNRGKEREGLEISAFTKKKWVDIDQGYKLLLKGDVSKKDTQDQMLSLENKMKREIKEVRPKHKNLTEEEYAKVVDKKPFRIFNLLMHRINFNDAKKELLTIEASLGKGKLTTFAAWTKVHALIAKGSVPAGWTMDKDSRIVHNVMKKKKRPLGETHMGETPGHKNKKGHGGKTHVGKTPGHKNKKRHGGKTHV
jgi:hypothetical protein